MIKPENIFINNTLQQMYGEFFINYNVINNFYFKELFIVIKIM